MAQRDDNGLMLSLSLGCPEKDNYDPSPSNLFRSPLPIFTQQKHNMVPRSDAFQFYDDHSDLDPRSSIGRIGASLTASIKLNKSGEEALMASSPNSILSSVSGKRTLEYGERASSSSDEEGGDVSARKKLRLCKEQSVVLEEAFREHNTLNTKQKLALAKQLNMKPRQVEVWFQNRRARTKLKKTEIDCEYLRHCFEDLNDKNRRLQKELKELRALKLLPPTFYTNLTNPTMALTMCPQCERVDATYSSKMTSLLASTTDNRHRMPLQLMGWNDSASNR